MLTKEQKITKSPSAEPWEERFDKLNNYNEKYDPILGCCGGDYCVDQKNGHDERIKSFITQAISEERDRIVGEVNKAKIKMKRETSLVYIGAYNRAIDDIVNIIRKTR